ncbi:hypothetical protein [Kineococcus sp. SYSU DK002]
MITGVVVLIVTAVLTHAASVRVERHERRAGARSTPWVGGWGS